MKYIPDDFVIYLIKRKNKKAKEYLFSKYSLFFKHWLYNKNISYQDYDYVINQMLIILDNLIYKYDYKIGYFYRYVHASLDFYLNHYNDASKNTLYFDSFDKTVFENMCFEEDFACSLIYENEKINEEEKLILEMRESGFKYREIMNELNVDSKKIDNTIQKFKKIYKKEKCS